MISPPPPQWQDIALAAHCGPTGPKKSTLSPNGRVIKFEFDYYPEGLEAISAQLKRQHIRHLASMSASQCTTAERRQAELLILGGRSGRELGRGHAALGGRLDLPLLCLPVQQTGSSSHYRSSSSRRVRCWPVWITGQWWSARTWRQTLRQAGVTGLELVPVGPDRPVQWYGVAGATHRLPSRGCPPNPLAAGIRWVLTLPVRGRSFVGRI